MQQIAGWSWLQRTAERRAQPAPPAVLGLETRSRETCEVATSEDGFSVLRCQEVLERFRLAADGHRELVESTTSTSVRPYDGAALSAGGAAPASSRYAEAMPAISATLGQMLDDFFVYAANLQDALEQQGVDVRAAAAASGEEQHQQRLPGSLWPGGSGGLFGWWQRKRSPQEEEPARQSGAQPSLQQLVRQSGAHTHEL